MTKTKAVWRHMIITPSPVTKCPTFSDSVPLWNVTYFMNGPHIIFFIRSISICRVNESLTNLFIRTAVAVLLFSCEEVEFELGGWAVVPDRVRRTSECPGRVAGETAPTPEFVEFECHPSRRRIDSRLMNDEFARNFWQAALKIQTIQN